MSLVGFKAQNHTQQVTKNGARDDVDDRGTKREFCSKGCTGRGLCIGGWDATTGKCSEGCTCHSAPYLAVLADSSGAIANGCDVCGMRSTHVTTPGGMRGCDDHFKGAAS